MKKVIVLLCALALSGCASQIMESYLGKDVQEIALDYGPPSSIIDLGDGKRGYQWHKSSNIYIPAQVQSRTTGSGSMFGGSGSAFLNTHSVTNTYVTPARSYTRDCFYTFIAEMNGDRWIVKSFRRPDLMCE